MGARKRPPKRRQPSRQALSRDPPDIRDIFRLHLEASRRRNDLLEDVRALKAAGKIKAARERTGDDDTQV